MDFKDLIPIRVRETVEIAGRTLSSTTEARVGGDEPMGRERRKAIIG